MTIDPGVLNAIDQAERIGDTAVADLLRREARLGLSAKEKALFDQYPKVTDVAICGSCGLSFPDVFPSARYPFEYDHEED